MIPTILSLALASPPAELADELPAARDTLATCTSEGCDPTDGARAAWLVALGTYLDTGEADGELTATVRLLDAELFAELPPVLQDAATAPSAWATEPRPPTLTVAVPEPGTAAVIPIGGPVASRAERLVSRHLGVDLTWSPPQAWPELEQRLHAYVSDCTLDLASTEYIALRDALPDGEVYVALPDDDPRHTQLWRLDDESESLWKVIPLGPTPLARADAPVRVYLVPWGPSGEVEPDKLQPIVDGAAEQVTMAYSEPLLDALMEHPNECHPDLPDDVTDMLFELSESFGGTVYFQIGQVLKVWGPMTPSFAPMREQRAWRWDPSRRRLKRVDI